MTAPTPSKFRWLRLFMVYTGLLLGCLILPLGIQYFSWNELMDIRTDAFPYLDMVLLYYFLLPALPLCALFALRKWTFYTFLLAATVSFVLLTWAYIASCGSSPSMSGVGFVFAPIALATYLWLFGIPAAIMEYAIRRFIRKRQAKTS